MSDILGVYAFIRDLDVRYGDVRPTVYGIDELPGALSRAQLPARLLYPFSTLSEDLMGRFGSIGGRLVTVDWSILDLYLHQPVKQGTGLYDVADDIIGYCGAYADAIRGKVNVAPSSGGYGHDQATLQDVRFLPGIWPWPMDAPEDAVVEYYGVAVVLSVREHIS